MVQNETNLKIKCLRSDNGVEFTSNLFQQYYEENGIKRQFSTTRTPKKNGVAERKKRTIQEMGKIMLKDSKLDEKLIRQYSLSTEVFSEIIATRPHMNYGKEN